jgi:hypothetical protein
MFGLLSLLTVNAGALNTTQADVDFVAASTNDAPLHIDPGYAKDVGACASQVLSDELVEITLLNGYPSYTCIFTVTIQNTGMLPVKLAPLQFDVPEVLTVADVSNHTGIVLEGGQRETETFTVHVEQIARQGAEYVFTIHKTFELHATGTIGFWKNWNSHKTYTKTQIETWLVQINNASNWYGPATVQGMVNLFNVGTSGSATPMSRFLAQCLASNLNLRSGRQDPTDPHDVTGADPGNYLGLANPSASTLPQILGRIETKFGTSPTNAQFLIMKDVCDKLNNAAI